jgi:hypothetical protein
VDDLDLQDDGKVVIAYPALNRRHPANSERVAWASTTEPRLHRVGLPPAPSYRVRLAGDRIGFDRIPPGSGMNVRSDMGVADLAGHATLLGTGGDDDTVDEHFDFDGHRLAWFSNGCHQATVHVRDVHTTGTTHTRRHCALLLKMQPLVRRGSTRLVVDCFGFSAGICVATNITVRFNGRVLGTGQTYRHVRLNNEGRYLLATHPDLPVQLTATLTDSVGRREPRTGRAVLRSR